MERMHMPLIDLFGHRARRSCYLILAVLLARLAFPQNAPTSDTLWNSHIEPLLKEHCAECHNPAKSKSGLDLSSFQSILRGGERGAAVIPGRPNESNLYKFLSSDSDPHMPPAKRAPLGEEEAGLIKKWIQDLPEANAAGIASNHSSTNSSGKVTIPRLGWKPRRNMPASSAVDHFLELAWKLDKIKPARRADDGAFVRRAYLDIIGRIPTAKQAGSFVKDRAKDKRTRLIDALLASDEYATHMREIFDPVLMSRRGPEWEDKRANQRWFAFLDDAFRRNRPWNEVIRELIVARPVRPEDRGALWYLYERQNSAQAVAEALAPVIFGVQVKCAQCHDHMVAREIKQAHYWGMVAAFNRSKNVETTNGPGVAESAVGGFASFANLKKESQPALLTFFNGRKVDEAWPAAGEKETDSAERYIVPPPKGKEKPQQPAVPKFSRREAFAEAVTRDNPLLARAMVNRIWAMLFGRGIVHPVDLMDSKHPPSQPELLDWLAHDFEGSGYDVKRLLRALCNTKAYQLAPGCGKPASPGSFAGAIDKPLSGEQLFRSLLVATGNQPDAEGKIAGQDEKQARRAFVAQFPDLFPIEYNATLYQAMFLANSSWLEQVLAPRAGNLSERLLTVREESDRVREAFANVFGREPDPEELQECAGYLAGHSPEAGVKHLLWAMLSSAEFQLNH